jgi:hypothetical protein
MKLIEKNDVYPIYKDKKNQVTMIQYFEEAASKGILSKERYTEAKALMDVIFRLRQTTGKIDNNFREVFSEDGQFKGINDGSNLGADIGVWENKGKQVLCMNVEFGVNFALISPKLEDAEEYLVMIENVTIGLKDPEQFNILSNYNKVMLKLKEKGSDNKPGNTPGKN